MQFPSLPYTTGSQDGMDRKGNGRADLYVSQSSELVMWLVQFRGVEIKNLEA